MAKFNPVGMAVGAAPLVIGGVALYEGYVALTDSDSIIPYDPLPGLVKPIVDSIRGIIDGLLGGGGDGNGTCTKTCTAPQEIDEETCTCVTPDPGCTTTCTAPQVLDPATCTCKTPTTPPPTGTQCWGDHLSDHDPIVQDYLCNKWCGGTRCNRYCFCQECTTGPCKK